MSWEWLDRLRERRDGHPPTPERFAELMQIAIRRQDYRGGMSFDPDRLRIVFDCDTLGLADAYAVYCATLRAREAGYAVIVMRSV